MTLRILVVEDIPSDADLVRYYLSKAGLTFAAEVVETRETYIRALREFTPDVILSDYSLPHFDGMSALRLAQEILPDAPFILITGTLNEETAVSCMKAGAADYILKDNITRLLPAIQAALSKRETNIKRREAEENLRASEQKYRLLFEGMISGCALCEIISDERGRPIDYRYLSVNAAFEKMTGLSAAAILGKTVLEVMPHPESHSRIERYGRVALTREPAHFEQYFHVFGKYFEVRAFSPEQGKFVTMFNDITEKKNVEAKLRQLSTAVEQSPASIIITDVQGNIEYVNAKFEQITGYTLAEVKGSNPRFLKSGRSKPEQYKQLWDTILSRREWRGEIQNKKKNGELFWESAVISAIVNDQGTITHFLAVKEDITEKKALEENLRQAQKMESIGTLAGGIAHDFNNILSIILGHAGMLRDIDRTQEGFLKSLDAVETATLRGASLVKQILTFARKTEVKFDLVRINDVAKELTKLLEETFPKSIAVNLDLGSQLPFIDGDATQLHQTLLNLCVNARDAMPGGGNITIATRAIPGDAVRRRFHDAHMEDYVQLAVSDTGTGVTAEVLARMFEPFFTTKELGKGTGLGLSVVHGIIREHKGFIDVESTLGKGTKFSIYLPVPADRTVEIPVKDAGDRVVQGNETILLVEDEELLRTAIEHTLTANGYHVIVARDGLEAVETFKKRTASIALVMMDLGLPNLSGIGALQEIRFTNHEVRCIVMSGYLDPEVREHVRALSFTALLPKPYPERDLLLLVRTLLDGPDEEKTVLKERRSNVCAPPQQAYPTIN